MMHASTPALTFDEITFVIAALTLAATLVAGLRGAS